MRSCIYCDQMAVRYGRWTNRCAKHFRFYQMQHSAKSAGKFIPTLEQLDALVPKPFQCLTCKRELIWFMKDDPKNRGRVISLQHDRDGSIRLICHSCNGRHDDRPGDSFYQEGMDRRRCGCCGVTKAISEFGTENGRFQNKKCVCKPCSYKRSVEWKNKNREHVNAKWREAWRKRTGRI